MGQSREGKTLRRIRREAILRVYVSHLNTCQANANKLGKLPNSGSFIRPTREVDPPISFLEGLKRKYTTVDDPQEPRAALSLTATKVIEEVGFDKILKKLARLKELEIVLLDALRISRADDVEEIRETCPSELFIGW